MGNDIVANIFFLVVFCAFWATPMVAPPSQSWHMFFARWHEVRPSITGWAQCHGRNAISRTEKFKLDVWYVDHLSFKTDVNIIFTTIKKSPSCRHQSRRKRHDGAIQWGKLAFN